MLVRSHVPIFFITASFCLLIFVNLSGSVEKLPALWWSEVKNEVGLIRWFSYKICVVGANNENIFCTPRSPATPFSPVDSFIGYEIPVDFVERRTFYYYTSTFAYAGLLLGVIFTAFGLFIALLECCNILKIRNLVMILISVAFVFVLAAATTQTAAHVSGTQIFSKYLMPAKIGTTMFALMWSSFVALFLAVIIIPKSSLGRRPAKIPIEVEMKA